MWALMSPKLWITLAVAAALAVSHGFAYKSGKATVRADWDAERVVQLAAAAKAESENRKIENDLKTKVIEAQNEATLRNKKLQTAAADARAVGDSLRDDLAAITSSLPGLTSDACRSYATTANTVLGELGREAENLARAADSHSSDTLTCQQAWPK